MGKLVEGLWDCKYCTNKGIGGSMRECPNCGKPRDEDTKFYMPGQIKYVDEEKAKTISRESDWLCMYCNSLNSASNNVCSSCGAERTSENLNYFENRDLKDVKQSSTEDYADEVSVEDESDDTVDELDDEVDDYEDSNGDTPKKNLSTVVKSIASGVVEVTKEYWKYALIALSIIAVIIGVIWIFIPKEQTITIDSTYWERSIAIESYQTVNESDWTLPDNARLHESRREIYRYEQVLDHYEDKTRQVEKQRISHYEERVSGYRDLGNGYFEEITERVPVYETYYETEHYQEPVYRSEPVYKTKYYYEIDKWLYDRTLTTSGYDKSPYWADTSNLKSDERESTKKEEYYIIGTNSKGKTQKIEMSYDEWNDLLEGDTVKVKVSIFGNGELVT